LEGALLYVNYIARIRLGAKEMNPIWRKFDLMKGKMKFMSFILMPLLVIGGILVLFSLRNLFEDRSIYLASGILIGFLLFNFMVDYLTLYNFRKTKRTYHMKQNKEGDESLILFNPLLHRVGGLRHLVRYPNN
jgi:hypothetical protein